MPTFLNDGKITALFMFNHIISRFGVLKAIIIDQGSYLCNHMMVELRKKLGFHHENPSPYYPRANGHKSNWHLKIF
jgi:hypothetical protein